MWTVRMRPAPWEKSIRKRDDLSEVPSITHPLGIRPAGEGGTVPALAVIINAIVDALAEFGVRHIEMPATPQNVWRAINTARP